MCLQLDICYSLMPLLLHPCCCSGEHLRTQLLQPGGAMEPLDLLSGLLGSSSGSISAALQHIEGGWAPRVDSQTLARTLTVF